MSLPLNPVNKRIVQQLRHGHACKWNSMWPDQWHNELRNTAPTWQCEPISDTMNCATQLRRDNVTRSVTQWIVQHSSDVTMWPDQWHNELRNTAPTWPRLQVNVDATWSLTMNSAEADCDLSASRWHSCLSAIAATTLTSQNQHTRELISARKSWHRHNNKDRSRLR